MIQVIQRSWFLTRPCLQLLGKNKKLWVFPALSLLAGTFLAVVLLAPTIFWLWGNLPATPASFSRLGQTFLQLPAWQMALWLAALFLLILLGNFILLLANASLVAAILDHFAGEPISVRKSLARSAQRWQPLLGWSFLGAFFHFIVGLFAAARPSFLERLIPSLAGLAWSAATFLVLPVLVFEEKSPRRALGRSAELFKRTWGEQAVFRLGFMTLAKLAIVVVGLGLPGILILVGVLTDQSIFFFAGLIGWLFLVPAMLLLSSFVARVFQEIYCAALYSYAITGILPDGFGSNFDYGKNQ